MEARRRLLMQKQDDGNLFDISTVLFGYTVNGVGTLAKNASRSTSEFIDLDVGNYKVTRQLSGTWWKMLLYQSDGTFIRFIFNGKNSQYTFTLDGAYKARISFDYLVNAEDNVRLEKIS